VPICFAIAYNAIPSERSHKLLGTVAVRSFADRAAMSPPRLSVTGIRTRVAAAPDRASRASFCIAIKIVGSSSIVAAPSYASPYRARGVVALKRLRNFATKPARASAQARSVAGTEFQDRKIQDRPRLAQAPLGRLCLSRAARSLPSRSR